MAFAGDIVRADDAFTEWATFTPTFLNFTLGNGTRAGYWRRVGNHTIEFYASVTLGSTSSVTGALGMTLPGGLSADGTQGGQMTLGLAYDTSAAVGYVGSANTAGGTSMSNFFGPNVAFWNATRPMTWATGDILQLQGFIKVTS